MPSIVIKSDPRFEFLHHDNTFQVKFTSETLGSKEMSGSYSYFGSAVFRPSYNRKSPLHPDHDELYQNFIDALEEIGVFTSKFDDAAVYKRFEARGGFSLRFYRASSTDSLVRDFLDWAVSDKVSYLRDEQLSFHGFGHVADFKTYDELKWTLSKSTHQFDYQYRDLIRNTDVYYREYFAKFKDLRQLEQLLTAFLVVKDNVDHEGVSRDTLVPKITPKNDTRVNNINLQRISMFPFKSPTFIQKMNTLTAEEAVLVLEQAEPKAPIGVLIDEVDRLLKDKGSELSLNHETNKMLASVFEMLEKVHDTKSQVKSLETMKEFIDNNYSPYAARVLSDYARAHCSDNRVSGDALRQVVRMFASDAASSWSPSKRQNNYLLRRMYELFEVDEIVKLLRDVSEHDSVPSVTMWKKYFETPDLHVQPFMWWVEII